MKKVKNLSDQETLKSRPIACDLSVFSEEERNDHELNSINILKSATKVEELKDGYAFAHPYSAKTFMSIAQWVITENKCCPFFVFEIAIEPLTEGHEIWLRLRGNRAIKEFLYAKREELGLKNKMR